MIALSDQQSNELRLAGSTLRVERRHELLKLIAAYLQIEGEHATDPAFTRALKFAINTLPASDDASVS